MLNSSLKILIVDDSAFFRHRIAEVIEPVPDMSIVGYATNGEDAIQKANELRPDLITMDVQMPVVDGITAVRRIMAECPTRILMLSALTRKGARETLEALEAGAIDFLPKELDSLSANTSKDEFTEKILEKLQVVGRSQLDVRRMVTGRFRRAPVTQSGRRINALETDPPRLVVIGTSTGGPVALQAVLSSLPRIFPLPVLVAVHMPGSFTSAYAERLNTLCAIHVSEATDHTPLRAGQVLIAPGGKQMIVARGASGPQVRIKNALPDDLYHPSVDQLFISAAREFGSQALGMILTGMGSDGLKGGQQLKAAGAQLWSQDEKSCVVYGMPQAIEGAGLSNRVLPIEEMGPQLIKQL
ncbi:MAG: chemotaxis response regulator protein-glutamate methylesterase [Pseudomonadota bacterium]